VNLRDREGVNWRSKAGLSGATETLGRRSSAQQRRVKTHKRGGGGNFEATSRRQSHAGEGWRCACGNIEGLEKESPGCEKPDRGKNRMMYFRKVIKLPRD